MNCAITLRLLRPQIASSLTLGRTVWGLRRGYGRRRKGRTGMPASTRRACGRVVHHRTARSMAWITH